MVDWILGKEVLTAKNKDTKLEKSNSLKVTSQVITNAKTGVEMEALVAVSISCPTVYDMCKNLSKDIHIKSIKLLSKTGGNSD